MHGCRSTFCGYLANDISCLGRWSGTRQCQVKTLLYYLFIFNRIFKFLFTSSMLFQKGGCSMRTCPYEYDRTFVRQRPHFRFKCSAHIGYYSAGYFDQGDYTPYSAISLFCLLILLSVPFAQNIMFSHHRV